MYKFFALLTKIFTNNLYSPVFYRWVIVYVSLSATLLGLAAIILIKVLELLQARMNIVVNVTSTCIQDTEAKPNQTNSTTQYGTIQNGNDLRLACPL